MCSSGILSETDYKKILKQDFPSDAFEIVDIIEHNKSDIGMGIMGGHYVFVIKAKIKDEIRTKRYFAKTTHSPQEIQNMMIKIQGAFEKEVFTYEVWFKKLNKIPNYHVDFMPKCYLAIKDKLFVLEDLQEIGYQTNSSGYMLDVLHIKLALDTAAKFHAASIIFEEHESKVRNETYSLNDEYSQYFQEPLYRTDEDYLGHKLLKCGERAVLALIDVAPQFADNKEQIKRIFSKNVANVFELVKPSAKYRNVICHGDLWTNNLLFKYNGNAPVDAKLIDFQALRYTVPAHDVYSLLQFGGTIDVIMQNEPELLPYYYECLREHLHEHNIDINNHMTYDEYLESVDYIKPFVLVQKMTFLTMYLLESRKETLNDQDSFARFMYEDRADICVEEYLKDVMFRDFMDDAFAFLTFLK